MAGVVLASGFSRRLGRPKQDIVLGGQSLLSRAVQTAVAASLQPVFAVVQDPSRYGELRVPGVTIVGNAQAGEGMAASVRLGVEAAARARAPGLVLMTCDQPLLRPEHLYALCAQPERVTASAYDGRKGVPAYFPAASFAQLLSLQGDRGARDLLHGALALPDEDLALDIDTMDDLRRAETLLADQDLPA